MKTPLRIAGTVKESIVDGPGIRYVVFAQGCKHKCPGCHNPGTHSFEGGTVTSVGNILEEIKKNPLLDGVTLSGGEPFEQAQSFAVLASHVKKAGLNVMTYTGYTYEKICEHAQTNPAWAELLSHTDVLVDGRFEMTKRNLMLKFRGSENQRIIDINRSKRDRNIIFAEV
ncbi:MAG: anaerobic ribonucleoside-triphosphate reductase activating protein [Clostridia bacterium]|nr:anaerobic ribonucleoside-triphosphate reductase activating protein [Clostridia bacterium]